MTAREPNEPRDTAEDAKARAAKGSVQEAIGKLIGDDAVEQRGKDQQEAASRSKTPPRP